MIKQLDITPIQLTDLETLFGYLEDEIDDTYNEFLLRVYAEASYGSYWASLTLEQRQELCMRMVLRERRIDEQLKTGGGESKIVTTFDLIYDSLSSVLDKLATDEEMQFALRTLTGQILEESGFAVDDNFLFEQQYSTLEQRYPHLYESSKIPLSEA